MNEYTDEELKAGMKDLYDKVFAAVNKPSITLSKHEYMLILTALEIAGEM